MNVKCSSVSDASLVAIPETDTIIVTPVYVASAPTTDTTSFTIHIRMSDMDDVNTVVRCAARIITRNLRKNVVLPGQTEMGF